MLEKMWDSSCGVTVCHYILPRHYTPTIVRSLCHGAGGNERPIGNVGWNPLALELDGRSVLQTLDWHIRANGSDTTCANSDLTDAVNLQLKNDHELFHANPRQVGHVLTSFGLAERKRTSAGWVLLLSRDTRKRIHSLLRRYALELYGSVNRVGCTLCTDPNNSPSGSSKSAAEPQKTALSNDPKIGGSELGELRALKTEQPGPQFRMDLLRVRSDWL